MRCASRCRSALPQKWPGHLSVQQRPDIPPRLFGALGVQLVASHPGPGSSEAHPAGRMIGKILFSFVCRFFCLYLCRACVL